MKAMNKYIDHTLLKADATKDDIKNLCEEAIVYKFASVCVNSCWVEYCKELLKDTKVKVCSVAGFPLGAGDEDAKAFEIIRCVVNGADEIDVVINIGKVKSHDYDSVRKELHGLRFAAKDKCLKVILETCLLTDEEIVKACELCVEEHVDYVKTSTGFSTGGATVEAVKLMYDTVKGNCKVKASGGIRNLEDMKKMIHAGAERIGTSAGVKILSKE